MPAFLGPPFYAEKLIGYYYKVMTSEVLKGYFTLTLSLNNCNFSYLLDSHCRLSFSKTYRAAYWQQKIIFLPTSMHFILETFQNSSYTWDLAQQVCYCQGQYIVNLNIRYVKIKSISSFKARRKSRGSQRRVLLNPATLGTFSSALILFPDPELNSRCSNHNNAQPCKTFWFQVNNYYYAHSLLNVARLKSFQISIITES